MDKPVYQDVIVIELTTQRKFMLYLDLNSTLSVVREMILEQLKQQVNFFFLKSNIDLGITTEKTRKLSNIIKNDQTLAQKVIQIRIEKKTNPAQDDDNKKKKTQQMIDQSFKTKQTLQKVLKDVDDFADQRKKQTDKNQQASRKKLDQIQLRLKNMNIQFNQPDVDKFVLDAKKKLHQKIQDSQKLLKHLYDQFNITDQQLIMKSPKICQTYFNGKKCISRILNYQKLAYHQDGSSNQLGTGEYTCYTKEISDKFSKQYQEKSTSGSLNVVVLAPGALIKAGFDISQTSQVQTIKREKRQSQYAKKIHSAIYIGKSFQFTRDLITVLPQINRKYEQLVKNYFDPLYNRQQLKKQCYQFKTAYGNQVDQGTYAFGNTFTIQHQMFFSTKLYAQQIDKCYAESLTASLAVGGIFSGAIGAAKGHLDMTTKTGSSQQDRTTKVDFTSSIHIQSNPPVSDYKQWKDLVIQRKGFWKILGSHIQNKVSLFQVLRNDKNASEYLKRLNRDSDRPLNRFQAFIQKITKEDIKDSDSQFKNINAIIVGLKNSGKTYLANQLYGEKIDSPFNNQIGSTSLFPTQKQKKGIYQIYDTIGLLQNTKINSGQAPKELYKMVNSSMIPKQKQVKSRTCFILVIKAENDKIGFNQPIENMVDLFGVPALKSTLIILNFEKQQKDFSVNNLKQKYPDLLSIQKKYPEFEAERQIFWNYSFDKGNQNIVDLFEKYSEHRTQIFSRVKTAPDYFSDQAIIQVLQIEVNKKKEEQERIKQETLKQLDRMRQCSLQSQTSSIYIGFGNYVSRDSSSRRYGAQLIKQGGDWKLRLAFINQINFQQGKFMCKLTSHASTSHIQLSFGQYQVSTNSYGGQSQETRVHFVEGKKGLIDFAAKGQAQVRLSHRQYMKYDDRGYLTQQDMAIQKATVFKLRNIT